MLGLKSLKQAIFVLLMVTSNYAQAISEELQALVKWETRGNAVALRDSKMVLIEHYEIPLKLLEYDISKDLAPATKDSLIFIKGGEEYVRWVINPEDTKWHFEVEKFLASKGASTTKHTFFQGYKTASRSYLVVNPQTKAEFSVKVSTNITGGNWTDKKQTFDDAKQIRMIMEHINAQIKKTGDLKRSILLDEPAVFGIKSLDQGMVIRAYDGLAKSGHKYLPGFSAVHEKVGASIARQNGSEDPAKFWNENYNKPLARALAEFIATTGVAYDSPHSQNFLIELDLKNKPTGRIVLRDFGDSYLNTEFMSAVGRADISAAWEAKNVLKGYIYAGVGVLHGNQAPSWIDMKSKSVTSDGSYQKWGDDFYLEFVKEYNKQTGLDPFLATISPKRNGAYFSKNISMATKAGLEFLDLVKAGTQRANFRNFFCNRMFAL